MNLVGSRPTTFSGDGLVQESADDAPPEPEGGSRFKERNNPRTPINAPNRYQTINAPKL